MAEGVAHLAAGTVQVALATVGGVQTLPATELPNGVVFYDPGLSRTAFCRSALTGHRGEQLLYRGVPAATLVDEADVLRTFELLTRAQTGTPTEKFDAHLRELHSAVDGPGYRQVLAGMPSQGSGTHSLAVGLLEVSALREVRSLPSTDEALLAPLIVRDLVAAMTAARAGGLEQVAPQNELAAWSAGFVDDRRDSRILDQLLIWQTDHGMACSTTTTLAVASAGQRPLRSLVAGLMAWEGPLHAGATEGVISVLQELAAGTTAAELLAEVTSGRRRLPGFGHRVFKSDHPDERVTWLAATRDRCERASSSTMIGRARDLERAVEGDEYFRRRQLAANPDWYNAQVLLSLGISPEMVSAVHFAGRAIGLSSHWLESRRDRTTKLIRPKQIDVEEI